MNFEVEAEQFVPGSGTPYFYDMVAYSRNMNVHRANLELIYIFVIFLINIC